MKRYNRNNNSRAFLRTERPTALTTALYIHAETHVNQHKWKNLKRLLTICGKEKIEPRS